MTELKYLLLLFGLIFWNTSCCDDEPIGSFDCAFEQNDEDMDGLVDDTELAIMKECDESAFTMAREISNNLIGEWELIGHAESTDPTASLPCGYITFTEDQFTFDFNDGITDLSITQSWSILVIDADVTFYSLSTDEYIESLEINRFCPQYMYVNATP